MAEANTKIVYLTDELIQLYSRNNVLYSSGDFNMKSSLTDIPGGVYDHKIFGSVFSNQCNCGQVHTVGLVCPRCKSRILDQIESFRRFARIESPVYFCTELKFHQLRKFLVSHFRFKYVYDYGEVFPQALSFKVLENLQFDWDKDNEQIIVTDNITDISKCSYEGILAIIISYFPELLNEYKSFINTMILVVPVVMRAPVYTFINGVKKLKNDQLTVIYKNILYAINDYFNEAYPNVTTESGRAFFRGNLRRFLSKSVSNISRLLAPSKQNMARLMQSNRLSNSGRCTIVPAPELKADEVYIPIHLMYECCKDEFISVIQDHYQCSVEKANLIYREEANTTELQDLFEEYIEGNPDDPTSAKYVFINRNPTLHELNILMCRVHLTRDYCMKIPLVVCAPIGGDFDGDTLSFYAVPKKNNADYLEDMSPKNIIYYKKNHKPLFTPSHEAMMGLIYATKVRIPEGDLESFDSIDDANQFRRKNKQFTWQTLFNYKGNKTTLARLKLSQLFGKDIDAYLGSLENTLNSKNIIPLYSNLEEFEDRLERIQQIQEFALNIATISGATAPTLSQLYADIDSDILSQIREVENSDKLTEKEKYIKVQDLYRLYAAEQEEKFDDSVKVTIKESSRAKISQLLNISLPQFNVGPNKDASISESRLITGMTPEDLLSLAVENRAVQAIKVNAVPLSGYLTRQFAFLAMSYKYSAGKDEDNTGILLESKRAVGRTLTNGKIVPENNSSELVKVRSIVTSSIQEDLITSDMLPNMVRFKEGSRVGISLMTSLTEGLTQSGLSLKHGGALFNIEPNGSIYVDKSLNPQYVTVDSIFIKFTDTKSGKEMIFPKPDNFIQNYSKDGIYRPGELVGSTLKMNTPAYRLDSIITLCGARRVIANKKFARNSVLKSDCYAVNDGIIHYKVSPNGELHVSINDIEYTYNPNSMYLYPDGAVVKKYDRICSGVLDMSELAKRIHDYVDGFYFFRNQFEELIEGIAPELIEFLYRLIVERNSSKLKVHSVMNKIFNSKSFYTAIAFGNARKQFKNISAEGRPFEADTITQVILSLITDNKIV